MPLDLGGQVVGSRDRPVLLDRFDSLFPGPFGGVHLTFADDLVIFCLEHKERLRGGGGLALKLLVVGGVCLYRLNAIECGVLGGIEFAAQDDLSIGGLEIEDEMAIRCDLNS